MNIAVIGAGYVGLVSSACFAEMGNKVVCVDKDQTIINKLLNADIPIYEPGLKELVSSNQNKSLFFTSNIEEAIKISDIIFIAVGTPMSNDGNADLSFVFNVAESIGETIESYKIIVSKSTVPVGTTTKIKEIIQSKIRGKEKQISFDVVSNPEFLKEGSAVKDFMKPDRVVIGAEKDTVFSKMQQLYGPFFRTRNRFIEMDIHSAEMTKYAANAMLATKISFMNEIANICEKVGADVNKVRIGIGSDSRIGYDFIYPGIGYGGTCFPKDISALIHLGKKNGYEPELISSVSKVNKIQKQLFAQKIINRFGENLSNLTFAVWGLSFKPETDDMRMAPSIYIIKELVSRGASIKVYDPKAMENAKRIFSKKLDVYYGENKYEIVKDVNGLILLTEWNQFRSPDFEKLKTLMKNNIIFDARNQFKDFELDKKNIEYYQIGKLT